jgi:hypothetical protein
MAICQYLGHTFMRVCGRCLASCSLAAR